MGLKTRLTAAAQGVGPWPEPAEKITWPVRWRWQPPVITVAGGRAAGAGGVGAH
ncbi:hypothetical protein [Verrucomicrobium spinosum]|uniref:hypothetical protein n=1 Tax=Verrucomicrobium spinosum TaxID=2736 RepID=UPI000AFE207F|nr:hypothetical protein [Verrucomicrobium spinosum]